MDDLFIMCNIGSTHKPASPHVQTLTGNDQSFSAIQVNGTSSEKPPWPLEGWVIHSLRYCLILISNLFAYLLDHPQPPPPATLWHVSVVSWDNYERVVSTFSLHSESLAPPNPKPSTQFMFHQHLFHKICYTELMEAILVLFLLRCEG